MTAAAQAKSLRQDVTKLRSLVLNADGKPLATYPLSIIPASVAILNVWRDRAVIVETWEGAFFHSPSTTLPVPKTLLLRQYAPITGEPKFCRRSVLLRDHMQCQYCGEQFESRDLTFDHVRPRADGGKTEWTNIVSACIPCNALKADRKTMQPKKAPRQPTNMELLMAGLRFLPNDAREDWGSWLYWGVELER